MNRKGKMAMIQNPISDHNVKKVGKNGINKKPMIKGKKKKINKLIKKTDKGKNGSERKTKTR